MPAIITPELFDEVAEQLQENRQRHRLRQRGAGHLLQGLVVCQQCGYACYGQTARCRNGARPYGYYRCIGADRRRGDGQRICHLPSVPLAPLESAVWNDVRELLTDPNRIEAEHQRRLQEHQGASASPQRQQLEVRRQRVQCGMSRLIDAYTDGLLDKTEFEPRLHAAKQRLKALDAEAKVLLERATLDEQLQALLERFEQFAERVRHRLDCADASLRRELIRALVKRIELGPDAVRIVYRIDLHPFDPGPSRGHLRHWVRRLDAAFFLLLFEPVARKKKRRKRRQTAALQKGPKRCR